MTGPARAAFGHPLGANAFFFKQYMVTCLARAAFGRPPGANASVVENDQSHKGGLRPPAWDQIEGRGFLIENGSEMELEGCPKRPHFY